MADYNVTKKNISKIPTTLINLFLDSGKFTETDTMTITGTAVSTTTAHNFQIGHVLEMTEGVNLGEKRLVIATTTFGTLTLESAFTTSNSVVTTWLRRVPKSFNKRGAKVFTNARPYLIQDFNLAQEIKESVTLNQSVTLNFQDDFDANGASYWRKLKALDFNYRNRRVQIKKGFEDFAETDYITVFEGLIQNIVIKPDKTVDINCKGLLALTDKEIPSATEGKIRFKMPSNETFFTLEDGTDMTQFPSTGYVRIDNEIIKYDLLTGFTFATLTRGQFNGDSYDLASLHEIGAEVQLVKLYVDLHPLDVINDLLNLGGIPDTDINLTSFSDIKTGVLASQKVRRLLTEPTKIKEYLKELREVFFINMWQGEDNKINVSFEGPSPPKTTYKLINDSTNIIRMSETLDDNEKSRVTRVKIYYNHKGNTDGGDLFDYRNLVVFVDAAAETLYLEEKAKTVKSKWLRSDLGAKTLAEWIGANYTRIFKNGRTIVLFDLETKDSDLKVGDIFKLTTSYIQDAVGAQVLDTKYKVISKKQVTENKWRYKTVDTSLDKKYGFIAAAGHPDFLTSSPGANLIAEFQIPTNIRQQIDPHGLSVGDKIKVTSGVVINEVREVVAIISSNVAEIATAFSADPNGATWEKLTGFATEAEKEYAFISNSSEVMGDNSPPSFIF